MLVSHFVHPDVRVLIFFKKKETAEKWRIDFEIGDIDTPAYLS